MGDRAEVIPSVTDIADLFIHYPLTCEIRVELFTYEYNNQDARSRCEM